MSAMSKDDKVTRAFHAWNKNEDHDDLVRALEESDGNAERALALAAFRAGVAYAQARQRRKEKRASRSPEERVKP